MLKLHKCMVGILIFACVLLFVLLLFFCLNRNEAKVDSWVGDFYLDKSHRVLYFECEW